MEEASIMLCYTVHILQEPWGPVEQQEHSKLHSKKK